MTKIWGVILMSLIAGNTAAKPALEKATFAGGCFWCMEPPFANTPGVTAVTPGYTGGHTLNPTYDEVCTGTTGHAEAVEVSFDPTRVTYDQLLEVFWRNIDPTQEDAQFADQGTQYRTAIFFHSEEQRRRAEASKKALAATGKFKRPIVTEVVQAGAFYPAEEHHRKFYLKNPAYYQNYKKGSGRADFLDRTWGKPSAH